MFITFHSPTGEKLRLSPPADEVIPVMYTSVRLMPAATEVQYTVDQEWLDDHPDWWEETDDPWKRQV